MTAKIRKWIPLAKASEDSGIPVATLRRRHRNGTFIPIMTGVRPHCVDELDFIEWQEQERSRGTTEQCARHAEYVRSGLRPSSRPSLPAFLRDGARGN